MNIMGVGPAEVLVILVVALIFVGPERLPRFAADIARTIREIRKYTGQIAAEFNEVIQDFDKETEGDRSQWKDIGEGLTGATRSITESLRGVRADVEGAAIAPKRPAATTPAATSTAPPSDAEPEWRDIAEPGPAPVPGTNGHAPAAASEEPR